jgi:hypothetical protein
MLAHALLNISASVSKVTSRTPSSAKEWTRGEGGSLIVGIAKTGDQALAAAVTRSNAARTRARPAFRCNWRRGSGPCRRCRRRLHPARVWCRFPRPPPERRGSRRGPKRGFVLNPPDLFVSGWFGEPRSTCHRTHAPSSRGGVACAATASRLDDQNVYGLGVCA